MLPDKQQSKEEIIIRDARQLDTELILQLAAECRLEFWKAEDYQKEIVRIEKNESSVLVAEIEGILVGFIVARFMISESSGINFENYSTEPVNIELEADILNIGVKKEYRKRGTGKILLKKILNKAKTHSVKSVWLEVRKSNTDALEFYYKNGFTKMQERKNFYSNPSEDAFIMCLKL